MKRIFTILVLIGLLTSSCGVLSPTGRNLDKDYRFNASRDRITLQHEVRGVWLTTVGGYDWPDKKDNANTQKQKLRSLIRKIREAGCNVVFFQVVSNMDAMYPSAILPWSHVITGTQGQDPGYDPLTEAINACREQGLEIHAWLNPLRAGHISLERSPRHVVKEHPEWIQLYGSNYFLDPALPEVRQHLAAIVTELMTRYDLDGIHMDDYFYPDGLQADEKQWNDSTSFALSGGGTDKEEWRYRNIDACVKAICDATHAARPEALFGISPAGRLENTLKLYADPRRWVAQGTVDYLVPQIYWPHGHRTADFKLVLDSWKDIVGDVPLYCGLAAYRLGETGFESMDEFIRQVEDSRKASWSWGHVWFRTAFVLTGNFLPTLRDVIYQYGSLVPKMGHSTRNAPARPTVTLTGKQLQWAEVEGADGYAVYQLVRERTNSRDWTGQLVYQGPHITFEGSERNNYVVISYSGREKSDISEVIFIPTAR